MRRPAVLSAPHCEIALRDPRCGPVADGAELLEARLRVLEHGVCLLEPLLLQKSAAEDELGVAVLVEVVAPAAEKLECVPRVLLCELRLARAQVNLRQRRDDVAGIRIVADLEENPVDR